MEFASLKPDKGVLSYAWNHQAHIASGPHFNLFLGQNTIEHKQVVIKQVDNISIINSEAFSNLLNEVQNIKPKTLTGCIKYIDFASSKDSFFFIQGFANGGNLRKELQKKQKFSDKEAIIVIQAIIKGFESLKNAQLIHGNLKPENIQIHNKGYFLNDYAIYNYYQHFQTKEDQFDEFLYSSPQVLSAGKGPSRVSEKNDIWALGLIFYEMIYGTLPWQAKSKAEYLQSIKKIPIRFPFNMPISETCKDFIKGCLQVDEGTRFTWDRIFKHPIVGSSGESPSSKGAVNQKAMNLNQRSIKLIRELQNVISKQNLDIEKLFLGFDKTGDKALDLHEFMKLVYVIQPKLEMPDIQELFQRFDENHDGSISLPEFKKLVIETEFSENNENDQLADFRGQKLLDHIVNIIVENNLDLDKMISQFDVTGDNLLKFGEFIPIIRVFDSEITDQDAKFIFKKFDKNTDAEISYDEFKTLLEVEMEKRKNIKQEKKKTVFSLAEKVLEDLKKVIVMNKLDINMVFKGFDKSGDGFLDFKEFKELVAIINARNTEATIKDLFSLFDKNNDNQLSLDEFRSSLLN